MSFVLLILALLISATPLTILFDGLAVQGLITALTAISLAIIAIRIRPGEAAFLSFVVRPYAIVAVVPGIWMIIQIAPAVGLAHPIWKSASAALGQALAGSISIDPGETIISFIIYVSAVAIAFVAAAVAIDRQRAKWILFTLLAATTFSALIALARDFGIITLLDSDDARHSIPTLVTMASFGIMFAFAAILHESQHANARRPNQVDPSSWVKFVGSISALTVCVAAVLIDATGQICFAVVYGIAMTGIVVAIRRFSLRSWGIAAVASVTLFVLVAVFTSQFSSRTVGLTTVLADHVPEQILAVTQRILSDTSWTGIGAGTFSAIFPIYQDVGEASIWHLAPTAAAAISIEMGRPFFVALIVAVMALVFALMRGALRRDRDFFYSAAGASCVVTIALLSFANAALLGIPTMIVVAAAVGMAIAQSKSRLV